MTAKTSSITKVKLSPLNKGDVVLRGILLVFHHQCVPLLRKDMV